MDGLTEAARDAVRSTLPPHSQQHRAPRERWALAAGGLGVVVVLLVGNAVLAVVLAALVAPVVSIIYVNHADGHEGAPLGVLALAVLGGGIVGAGLAMLMRQYLGLIALAQFAAMAQGRPPLSLILFLGVSLPLVGEILKLAAPLLLWWWPRFRRQIMDGVVFGVASGVGFAAASTLVNYWPIIRDGYTPGGAASLTDWLATLVGLAILRPLVHGATSGLIGAGIWAATLQHGKVVAPVLAGLSGALVYSLGELLLFSYGTLAVLTLHGLVLAVLLTLLWRTIREARHLDARVAGAVRQQ